MSVEAIALLRNKRVVLGVTGSVAAYKAVDLASKLTQNGAEVNTIMTEAAQKFVTPLTFQAITGRPVYTDLWAANTLGLATHIAHVGLAEAADLVVIAPATADTLARLAGGFASDLVAITALAARCPLVIAPAMDGGMYEHPATQENVEKLRQRGAIIIEPEEGRFASGLSGRGRLPETGTIIGAIRWAFSKNGGLAGKRVVITAGGTREPIDPVRYIGNRSSGKQGYALAQAALDAGAEVTLISSVHLPPPYGAKIIPIETMRGLLDAVMAASADADLLIMAAAVADFRPQTTADQKIKKTAANVDSLSLPLTHNEDILEAVKVARQKSGFPRVVIGFAAESENLLANARAKLERKGVDLLVANDISASDAGFSVDTNRVTLLTKDSDEQLDLMSKAQVAEIVVERAAGMIVSG
ncbi:MAG: bifunctional phosphopantothenoylcysteine decarboxylase/phosphopantothenate--cysteine ligase CoaBC [Anaerolineae bacterium]|nr:bifunctional phosphopantothenoylcysteine decarboxylase/phosphopantothenate--cysteine ligase CoaBC [Anaerolineae bacterium]